MKSASMNIPALDQLYNQQQNYNFHTTKINQIKSQQRHLLLKKIASTLQTSSIHKKPQNYEHRHNQKTV
jgi:hypothetical protein